MAKVKMSIFTVLKSLAKKFPPTKVLISARERMRIIFACYKYEPLIAPGHFYSPIPNLDEIRSDEAKIFGDTPKDIPGIALNEAQQLELLQIFLQYYKEIPFTPQKADGLNYFFENPAYSYSDAIILYCMIRFLQPKRIIEVGSGYSSCVIIDTNKLFFNNSISTTFIEPFPDFFMSLISNKDKSNIKLISSRLQDVHMTEFKLLEPNDILFIDSSHVSKVNSDVNRIFFEILPQLSSGIYIHFHDIYYPFEYPKYSIYKGIAWNEQYMLRTFLQYNHAFDIVLMNTFMETFHEQFFQKEMPLCLKNRGGSIWIRKN